MNPLSQRAFESVTRLFRQVSGIQLTEAKQALVVGRLQRLAQEAGYQVEETKLGGVRLVLITGHGEAWALWSAARHVVKIGGHGRDDVPEALVSSYGDRYPSTLTADVLEGPLPPGADAPAGDDGDEQPEYDPDHPRPDLDKYDPNTKLPGKHGDGDGDGDDEDGDD